MHTSARRSLGALAVLVGALLASGIGPASAADVASACPDTVGGWPLVGTVVAPPTSQGLLRLICQYETPGGYDDPDYGNTLSFDAHWWPEGTDAPSFTCPADPEAGPRIYSSTTASEVGWSWIMGYPGSLSDGYLSGIAADILAQVEPLAQQCPEASDGGVANVAITIGADSADDGAIPEPWQPADDGSRVPIVAAAAVVAAAAGAAIWQIRKRRHIPTLGDRLAADALRESIEAANAPSLADQLGAEQIREGLAMGGLDVMDGMPTRPIP